MHDAADLPGPTPETERELGEVLVQLHLCRDRLDALDCYAAAADTNQAIERLQAFMRGSASFA